MTEKTELEKNSETFNDRKVILEFLEYANGEGVNLANYVDNMLCAAEVTTLLDNFFGIDAEKLDLERRKLLEDASKL